MRAFVFTDASLARRAGQFVWLSINTEKKDNAAFLQKYPVEALPSFLVLDSSGKVLLKWVGGATVGQVGKILDDGSRAASRGERGVDELLARADRLAGENKSAQAAEAYRQALAKATPGWAGYPRALESMLYALQRSKGFGPCAQAAREAYPKLAATPSSANVGATGLDCALSLPESDPARADLVSTLAADCREVVATRRPDVAADDISSTYLTLAEERNEAKDEAGRRQVFSDLALYLEGQASAAKTPAGRAVFDSHRLTAYVRLSEPERAIPMLTASERDFPEDYNPPARLAYAYLAMKRWDDAIAASDRALARAYGPRRILILTQRSDIYAGKGDPASARKALEQALSEAEAFPPGQRSENQIAGLKKRLASLDSQTAPGF
jgi:tetratricopeptide (TPR) repeat protein